MKSINKVWMLLALLVVSLSSCYKDKGNYDFRPINEVSIQGVNDVYNVLTGEVLRIVPNLRPSSDASFDSVNYEFDWTALRTDITSDPSALQKIGASMNVNFLVNIPAGPYRVYYNVKDKRSGVKFEKTFLLNVTSSIYEGYLVMNEVNGKTRLDMLSYLNNDFVQYTDVLKLQNSKLPEQGKPIKVYCYPYASNFYGIYLLTASGSNKIHPETFDYDINYNLAYEMGVPVSTGFKAQDIIGSPLVLPGASWIYSDGNVYGAWTLVGQYYTAPVNAYSGTGTFRISPIIAGDYTSGDLVMYNEDEKRFVNHNRADFNSRNMSSAVNLFDFKTGKDLVYMEYNYSGSISAILKDPASGKYYLAKFSSQGRQSYYDELVAPDIQLASKFALSPELGYLFYSIGGKVYEYDLSLKTTKLMVDKGNAVVSVLSFQTFLNRTYAARTTTYREWAKLLTVASYEPNGPEGTNGKFELYTVPPVNGDLVLQKSWSGFGKIVSITYRER